MDQILAYKKAKIGPAFNFTAYIYMPETPPGGYNFAI